MLSAMASTACDCLPADRTIPSGLILPLHKSACSCICPRRCCWSAGINHGVVAFVHRRCCRRWCWRCACQHRVDSRPWWCRWPGFDDWRRCRCSVAAGRSRCWLQGNSRYIVEKILISRQRRHRRWFHGRCGSWRRSEHQRILRERSRCRTASASSGGHYRGDRSSSHRETGYPNRRRGSTISNRGARR